MTSRAPLIAAAVRMQWVQEDAATVLWQDIGKVDAMHRRGTMSVVTIAEAWPAAGRQFTVKSTTCTVQHPPEPPRMYLPAETALRS